MHPVSYPRLFCALRPLEPREVWPQQFCKGNHSQHPAPCSRPPQGQPGGRGDTAPAAEAPAICGQSSKPKIPCPAAIPPSCSLHHPHQLPGASSQPRSSPAEGWERRNTDKVFKPPLFLQKLCGKGKLLTAINKTQTTSRVEAASRTPAPGSARRAGLLLLTPCSRPTEPRRSPLLASNSSKKTPSCQFRFPLSPPRPHPALQEPRRPSPPAAIAFTAT